MPTKPPAKPRNTRLAPRQRELVDRMIWHGESVDVAAAAINMDAANARAILRQPKVKTLMRQELAEFRESAAARAIVNIGQMADDGAVPAGTRLDANKWLAGIEGVAPVSKHQVQADVRVLYDYGDLIDVTPTDAPSAASDSDS